MKGMNINPKSVTDMDMMNVRNQAQMISIMQKIGKSKRKKEVTLSKSSQKYLEQMVGEMRKQMSSAQKQFPNVFEFFAYLEKSLKVEKRAKRPKEKKLMLSFEEFDLLVKQMKEVIKGLEGELKKLKWYNIIKRRLYKLMLKQTQLLLGELK